MFIGFLLLVALLLLPIVIKLLADIFDWLEP